MKTNTILGGIMTLYILTIIVMWLTFKPAHAYVEVPLSPEPTAFLHDSTQFQIGNIGVAMRMVRFRDGTVCVTAKTYNSSDSLQLECDFSRSSTVKQQ